MAESKKITEWKRRIAHKRRKQEEKIVMKVYNDLTKDYNKVPLEFISTPSGMGFRGLHAQWTLETQAELQKAFGIPKHMMGNKHGSK